MESNYDRLQSILRRELELHARLLAVLEDEQNALRDLEAEQLLALANEKDSLALQLKALEESRRLAVESIQAERGVESDVQPRLSELAKWAPGAMGAELERLGSRLREIIESGRERNENVRFLANHSLESVREAMGVVAAPPSEHQTYKARGGLQAYQRSPGITARRI